MSEQGDFAGFLGVITLVTVVTLFVIYLIYQAILALIKFLKNLFEIAIDIFSLSLIVIATIGGAISVIALVYVLFRKVPDLIRKYYSKKTPTNNYDFRMPEFVLRLLGFKKKHCGCLYYMHTKPETEVYSSEKLWTYEERGKKVNFSLRDLKAMRCVHCGKYMYDTKVMETVEFWKDTDLDELDQIEVETDIDIVEPVEIAEAAIPINKIQEADGSNDLKFINE